MVLKELKIDIAFRIVDESSGVTFKTALYDLYSESSFFVKSKELYEYVVKSRSPIQFRVGFSKEDSVCSFTAESEKVIIRSGAFLTLLRQTSDIVQTNQRKHTRENITTKILVYRLSEQEFRASATTGVRELSKMVLSGMSTDISGGGFGLNAENPLRNDPEPYYLTEFTLNTNDQFLLPARIAWRETSPQLSRPRNEYGFAFLYDYMPNEERRLIAALIKNKMGNLGSFRR